MEPNISTHLQHGGDLHEPSEALPHAALADLACGCRQRRTHPPHILVQLQPAPERKRLLALQQHTGAGQNVGCVIRLRNGNTPRPGEFPLPLPSLRGVVHEDSDKVREVILRQALPEGVQLRLQRCEMRE